MNSERKECKHIIAFSNDGSPGYWPSEKIDNEDRWQTYIPVKYCFKCGKRINEGIDDFEDL